MDFQNITLGREWIIPSSKMELIEDENKTKSEEEEKKITITREKSENTRKTHRKFQKQIQLRCTNSRMNRIPFVGMDEVRLSHWVMQKKVRIFYKYFQFWPINHVHC